MAREKNKARTHHNSNEVPPRPCIGKLDFARIKLTRSCKSGKLGVPPDTTFDVLVLCAQLLNEAGLHLSLLYVLFGSVRLHFC